MSKSRAGALTAAHWPDLPIADLVASRRGSDVPLTDSHLKAAIELFDRIMADVTT
ncbi:hypothetical protein [Lentzea kentuckyensis]|uniref:hypothetical protein n=1 Tax=Lentzea kentuckyensis TaxID=360086 RepID=UPI001302B991|nr:hypothetical protein [Lentzea kentuckyensis]